MCNPDKKKTVIKKTNPDREGGYTGQEYSEIFVFFTTAFSLHCIQGMSFFLFLSIPHENFPEYSGINQHNQMFQNPEYLPNPLLAPYSEGACPRYIGSICKDISKPIRAGLLLDVDKDKLVDLIASLSPVCNEISPKAVAQIQIDEIRQYDNIQLLNNCFWGNDSESRVNKERYNYPKRKRQSTEEVFFIIW